MSRAPPKPSPTDASGSQSKNEYIPAFISKKPFYISSDLSEADYLEHQRIQSLPQDTLAQSKWYDRGRKLGPAATKFRKGACENCGAMTHKTKDCLSRPRKHGAKWTGRDIQADEVVEDVKLGWDAKRDRWNGYDAREYSSVVKEYEELEALKKATAGINGQKPVDNGEDGDDATNDPEIESAKYAEETDMGRNQPTSTRNLRIREDTAKYLLNLDLESAKYDPKTRSMADVVPGANPNADNPASALLADENFMRTSGDALEFSKAQHYAWETQEKAPPGTKKLHLQANPTEGELLRKRRTESASLHRTATKQALLEKYGGAEHLQPGPLSFRAAENDRYVEYDEQGGVKGAVRKIASSKYREDVWTNNHTTVWGSWWSAFQWGYACCHSFVKNSYCTGEEGRRAHEVAERLKGGDLLLLATEDAADREDAAADDDAAEGGEKGKRGAEGGLDAEISPQRSTVSTAKKRTLREMRDGVTEEEMEAFKRNRASADDPMAKLLGEDGVLL
jgi:pre-mRNA-processing factor SLU7